MSKDNWLENGFIEDPVKYNKENIQKMLDKLLLDDDNRDYATLLVKMLMVKYRDRFISSVSSFSSLGDQDS